MADDIQLKRSNVPGLAPAASELLEGELALNTADGLLYAKGDAAVFVVNPPAAIVGVVSGGDNVSVGIAEGVATVSVQQSQVDWSEQDPSSTAFIQGKPLGLSEFDNDTAFVTASESAAAAPVQGIVGRNAATVTSSERVFTVDVPEQLPSDWLEEDAFSPAFVRNKPTALSQFINDLQLVDAFGASGAAPVQDIVAAGEVEITASNGVYTIFSPVRVQADWAMFDTANMSFIKNKPTKLSQFDNDLGYVDAAGAAAQAPVQSIQALDGSVTVDVRAGGEIFLGANLLGQVQADWAELDADAAGFVKNKPTSLSDFSNDPGYVNAGQAADASPVQDVVGGSNISVVRVNGVYTVSSDSSGTVTGVSASFPIVVSGTAAAPTVGVAAATQSQPGVVQYASESDIAGGVPARAVDASQLKGAIPTRLSQLTNDSGYVTAAFVNDAASGYLPTTGGTLTGALVISPTGSITAPTPAVGDSSLALATTEWVQRELAGVVDAGGQWEHGGDQTDLNPSVGFLRVSADNSFLAISKYSLDGFTPIVGSLPIGSIIELSVVRPRVTTEDGVVLETVSGLAITTE